MIVTNFYFFFYSQYYLIILFQYKLIILIAKIKKISSFFIIIFNILILLYFKYFNFFIENLSILFSESNISYIKVYLPLAISFFTFQQISYQIDNFKVYQKNIISYLLYVSFFPQLIAGPIIRYSHFIKEIVKKSFSKLIMKIYL